MKAIRIDNKWIVALMGVMSFGLAKTSLAIGPALARSKAAVNVSNYLPLLREACGANADIMKATYHAETQTVDLSDFNGCSITVTIDQVSLPPNGED